MVLHRPQAEDAGPSGATIADGDLVIVYERFDAMKAVTVDSNQNWQNKFGCFQMKDWIGRPFGSQVRAKGQGQGWVYLLRPTPELWTTVLRHRTQILYAVDIAMICAFMDLRPGLTVLEAGTGSGSLTHSLARAVAPAGHVHSFDFHEPRAREAGAEFAAHGLGGLVSVQARDVELMGFPDRLAGRADALFLDLPGPWNVVKAAADCLRPDGVFCSFSPCIEQVQRTCAALSAHGFRAPRTMECLLRKHDVFRSTVVCDLDAAEAAAAAPKKRKRDGASGAAANGGGSVGGEGAGQQGGQARQQVVRACPTATMQGHTGYLTFARLAVGPKEDLECPIREQQPAPMPAMCTGVGL